jgi:hypothetical protein
MANQGENVLKKHLTDVQTGLQTLSTNKKVTIDLSSLNYEKAKKVNIKVLDAAINKLEENFSGNCCQANCCQTCQSCQGCQGCQTCQGCQSCQKCQGCQTCQKCQYYMTFNCNCNCSDDS